MARNTQRVKSRANYILRKEHTKVYDGTIFENDHMTIVPDNGVYDEGVIRFPDSNFMFSTRTGRGGRKRHSTGSWISPDGTDFDFWTEEDCTASTVESVLSEPHKSRCNSLADFACYGSAVGLIEGSVNSVVMNFPAAIYYLGDEAEEFNVTVGPIQGTFYSVANDFHMDIVTLGASSDTVTDPTRVLSASYELYRYGSDGAEITNHDVSVESSCSNAIVYTVVINNTKLYVYQSDDGDVVLLSDHRGAYGDPIVRPTDETYMTAYSSMDEFVARLLDGTTNPVFTVNLDTPYQNNEGIFYSVESYTWPSVQLVGTDMRFPVVSGPSFSSYVARLLALAAFHDGFDSDNLWRMMTHDAIKNLDWTFMTEAAGEYVDASDIDTSRIGAVIRLYGRQFDDIKRYADDMSDSRTITYNGSYGADGRTISDMLPNYGWDCPFVGPADDGAVVTDPLFPNSQSEGYTSDKANTEFVRRMILNSFRLCATKGTRNGLETMLSLFGFRTGENASGPGTYQISEHIAVATNFPSAGEAEGIAALADDYEDVGSPFDDYPVAAVYPNGDAEDGYLVPWYDRNRENLSYMYFQEAGGWNGTSMKLIDLPITSYTAITGNGIVNLYGETLQYMKYVSNIDEMLSLLTLSLRNDMVCYVEDISDLYGRYSADTTDAQYITDTDGECLTHYFILKNIDLSPYLGFVTPEESDGMYNCYGWRNVLSFEFDGTEPEPTCDGLRVLYLESIHNKFLGNNPHVGYGEYDKGDGYIKYMDSVFKNKLDTGMFSMLTDDPASAPFDIETVKTFGFNVKPDMVVDNRKCHYFESGDDGGPEPLDDAGSQDSDMDPTTWDGYSSFYEHLINPEEGDLTDETAALSVVNVKNIHVSFNTGDNAYLQDYINSVVMPWMDEMVPATAILSYGFDE